MILAGKFEDDEFFELGFIDFDDLSVLFVLAKCYYSHDYSPLRRMISDHSL
jgi:hypothetical protein